MGSEMCIRDRAGIGVRTLSLVSMMVDFRVTFLHQCFSDVNNIFPEILQQCADARTLGHQGCSIGGSDNLQDIEVDGVGSPWPWVSHTSLAQHCPQVSSITSVVMAPLRAALGRHWGALSKRPSLVPRPGVEVTSTSSSMSSFEAVCSSQSMVTLAMLSGNTES